MAIIEPVNAEKVGTWLTLCTAMEGMNKAKQADAESMIDRIIHDAVVMAL